MVLHRLERLTLDESRAAGAQTLEVVLGLAKNLREVMSGERVVLLFAMYSPPNVYLIRSRNINIQHPEGSRSVYFLTRWVVRT
jgi:hypothetical protein